MLFAGWVVVVQMFWYSGCKVSKSWVLAASKMEGSHKQHSFNIGPAFQRPLQPSKLQTFVSMVPGRKCHPCAELWLVQKLHVHFLMDRVVRAAP